MNNIENIATELFNKIRSRFSPIFLTDEDGKETDIEKEARLYNFVYKTSDGVQHGPVQVSILDEKLLSVSFTQKLPRSLDDGEQKLEWEQFVLGMRKFAKRNMLRFDVRDMNKPMLTKRDVKQAVSSKQAKDNAVVEAIQWSGTTRTSIQEFGAARLIVRHSESVNEETPGARSRKIDSIFIETDQGERFRMPYNRLSLGRAMAQHIAHGGRTYDDAGQHILGLAEEMSSLSFFVRSMRNRQFEDTETTGMVESAADRYRMLRSDLNRLAKTRNYHKFAESFMPHDVNEDDYDIEALKERFVKRMFDDRLTDALPYVYRAYQQRNTNDRYMEEFENWTEATIQEGEYARPDDEQSIQKLRDLMLKPMPAGDEGEDAINVLFDIIGDDTLSDQFYQISQGANGSQQDVRPAVISWLENNGYANLAAEFKEIIAQQFTSQTQRPVEPATAQPQQSQMAQPARTESLDFLRQLAGIKK